jgi:indole-3-glycerol phosphate synthase
MRQLGYAAALIGTALMSRGDPGHLLREIHDATRTAPT